jgi:hypothetical protein
LHTLLLDSQLLLCIMPSEVWKQTTAAVLDSHAFTHMLLRSFENHI